MKEKLLVSLDIQSINLCIYIYIYVIPRRSKEDELGMILFENIEEASNQYPRVLSVW